MTDKAEAHHSGESDAELEHTLGTRNALLALWNPSGRPVSVFWDDSSIVTANNQTRSRLVQVHSVIHALLRTEYGDALDRLRRMGSLMAIFTALRSATLASQLLWKASVPTWQAVIADARRQTLVMLTDEGAETLAGADALAQAIRRNLEGDQRKTVLDCVAETATMQSQRARRGMGGFGAAVFAATLNSTSPGPLGELVEEHAALILALARGQTVTHRDGRLVVDELT